MRIDRRRCAPWLVCAALASTGCTGEETLQFPGEPVLSNIAGTQGAATITVALTGNTDRAVRAFGWAERRNHICELTIGFGRGLEARTTDLVTMNVCPGERQGREDRMLTAEATLDTLPLFINQIQVAYYEDRADRRIRGFRIWYASIAGIRTPRPDLECSETITGGGGIEWGEPTPGPCDEAWIYSKQSMYADVGYEFSPPASCPDNALATAVIAHVTATTDGEIVGLQLSCQSAVIDRG